MLDRIRRIALTALALGALAVGAATIANAASGGSTQQGFATTSTTQRPPGPPPGARGGIPPQRSDETLLTGDTAAKVKQAALDRVPGASVIRVETDAEGSPYEAHMTKSDGTHVTVKVDKDFKVTNIENDGTGPGGARQSGGTSTTPA